MMQLFFKAGELKKRSNRGFWQKRHFETLNSHLCYLTSAAKAEMCGAIDLRELAPPSVGKGAADRVVTLRREAAAFLPAASFELRAPDDRAATCAWGGRRWALRLPTVATLRARLCRVGTRSWRISTST